MNQNLARFLYLVKRDDGDGYREELLCARDSDDAWASVADRKTVRAITFLRRVSPDQAA